MKISICSYSFYRMHRAGKCDVFKFIKDSKALGCAELDPWNGHLEVCKTEIPDADLEKSRKLSAEDMAYLKTVKEAAKEVGLPFGCIAVDKAHIYEATKESRKKNRSKAYQWLAVAAEMGAKQVRIDSGGADDPADEVFDIIAEGYKDLTQRAGDLGIQLLIENHWGPSKTPDHLVRILEATPKLKLLFDSFNWKSGQQGNGWLKCVKFAACTHIKALWWTPDGKQELTQNTQGFIDLLKANGYQGTWGIESVPQQPEVDEMEGARRTVDLIRRCVGNH